MRWNSVLEISTLPSQLYCRGNISNDKCKTDTTRALYHHARYGERTTVSGPDSWKQKLDSQWWKSDRLMRREQRDAFVIYASSHWPERRTELLFSRCLFFFLHFCSTTCFSSFREEKSNERIEKKVNKWVKRKENYSVCRRRILSFGKVDRSTESTDITKDVSSNTILLLTIFSIVSSSNRGSIRR